VYTETKSITASLVGRGDRFEVVEGVLHPTSTAASGSHLVRFGVIGAGMLRLGGVHVGP
jgi:hypothetical protein